MNTLVWTVLPFVVALGLLVLVHELGHYLVARLCGVKVLRFSIGFGRPLLTWKVGKDQTEWALSMIPLGGYVKMLGEVEGEEVAPDELDRAFNRKPVWQRFSVVAAGPLFNLVFAVLLVWAIDLYGVSDLRPYIAPTSDTSTPIARAGVEPGDLVLSIDEREVSSWRDVTWALTEAALDREALRLRVRSSDGEVHQRRVDLKDFNIDDAGKRGAIVGMGLRLWQPTLVTLVDVLPDGAAARAGFQKGDKIIAVNGIAVDVEDRTINPLKEFTDKIGASAGLDLTVTVLRDGRALDLPLTPEKSPEGRGLAKFVLGADQVTIRYGPIEAIAHATGKTSDLVVITFKGIGKLITGQLSFSKNVFGPITIADFAGKAAKSGLETFIEFLALISVSLGVLNLLPIPVLDGGHLLYYAVEFIKGSSLSNNVKEIGQRIGLALLLILMVFAFYNDIHRLLSP